MQSIATITIPSIDASYRPVCTKVECLRILEGDTLFLYKGRFQIVRKGELDGAYALLGSYCLQRYL